MTYKDQNSDYFFYNLQNSRYNKNNFELLDWADAAAAAAERAAAAVIELAADWPAMLEE